MSDPKLTYLGPLDAAPSKGGQSARGRLASLPWGFLAIVMAPTLIALVYFLLVASPRYVSEARFIVRAQNQQTPSALGIALQGVGVASSSTTDAFAVHEFIKSRDGLTYLGRYLDLNSVFSPRSADVFSRAVGPWHGAAKEDVFEGTAKFVTVGYNSTNGISTLRVEAFTPGDAKRVADRLLIGSEELLNQLNTRSSKAAVAEAERTLIEAQERLAESQRQLGLFRNRQGFIDPSRTALESSQLIGSLRSNLAGLMAERSSLASQAPQSPQLAGLDVRIRAYQAQIEAERAKIVGGEGSLAPKIGEYERLILDTEIADRGITAARNELETARLDARRQQLYLDRIVEPNLPDKAIEPKRLLSILAVFATCLLIYGIGKLIWASVREHRS